VIGKSADQLRPANIKIYSLRKLSAGFEAAALYACVLIVIHATSNDKNGAKYID